MNEEHDPKAAMKTHAAQVRAEMSEKKWPGVGGSRRLDRDGNPVQPAESPESPVASAPTPSPKRKVKE